MLNRRSMHSPAGSVRIVWIALALLMASVCTAHALRDRRGNTLRAVAISSGTRFMTNGFDHRLLGTLGQPVARVTQAPSGAMLFQGVHGPGGFGGPPPRPRRNAAVHWHLYE